MTIQEKIDEIMKDPLGGKFIEAVFNIIETARKCPVGAQPFVSPMSRNYMNCLIDMAFEIKD